MEEQWAARNLALLDENVRAGFHNQAVNRWLSLRMEQLGAGLCLCAGLTAVALRATLSPAILVRRRSPAAPRRPPCRSPQRLSLFPERCDAGAPAARRGWSWCRP